jgi:hypothetical protein
MFFIIFLTGRPFTGSGSLPEKARGPTPMIPRIIHHTFLTSSAYPESLEEKGKEIAKFLKKYSFFRESWFRYNPHYTFMFWTLDEIVAGARIYGDKDDELAVKLLCSSLHYVNKSDIVRWLPLKWLGGVAVDTDMECTANFDELLYCSSFVGHSYKPNVIGNAIIGAEPGQKFINEALKTTAILQAEYPEDAKREPENFGVNVAAPYLLNAEKLYPIDYFYPFAWYDRPSEAGERLLKNKYPGSFAIHHWSGMAPDGWATEHKNGERRTLAL